MNVELIKVGIRRITEQLAEAKESVESLLTQNERCIRETAGVYEKIEALKDAVVDGEEEVDLGVDVIPDKDDNIVSDTRNNPMAG